ncbi:hypothetical protein ACP4OV_016088 [Aristida adscensionis]
MAAAQCGLGSCLAARCRAAPVAGEQERELEASLEREADERSGEQERELEASLEREADERSGEQERELEASLEREADERSDGLLTMRIGYCYCSQVG